MSGIGSSKLSTLLLILVVVLGSTSAYYNMGLTTATVKITSLQEVISEFQNRNMHLDLRFSASDTLGRNDSILGFNPVVIYNSVNQSVVTIQGEVVVGSRPSK